MWAKVPDWVHYRIHRTKLRIKCACKSTIYYERKPFMSFSHEQISVKSNKSAEREWQIVSAEHSCAGKVPQGQICRVWSQRAAPLATFTLSVVDVLSVIDLTLWSILKKDAVINFLHVLWAKATLRCTEVESDCTGEQPLRQILRIRWHVGVMYLAGRNKRKWRQGPRKASQN